MEQLDYFYRLIYDSGESLISYFVCRKDKSTEVLARSVQNRPTLTSTSRLGIFRSNNYLVMNNSVSILQFHN